eukprot:g4965.t2
MTPSTNDGIGVTINFYTNGVFTVQGGEPRSIDNPANAEFLDHIRRGLCPPELLLSTNRPIQVNLVRHGTDYKTQRHPTYSTFTLTDPGVSNMTNKANLQSANSAPIETGEWEGADETKPTTSLLIQLSDGSRVVARFNHYHTIRDIRR